MFTGKIKNIHFIGIGGIGMSGMAELLVQSGYFISGSDLNKNDRTRALKEMGINIKIGHSEDNVKETDLVVYSSAVNQNNIEIEAAKSRNIPIMKRAEMLAELVSLKPISIGVSGTHGKTTTCSLIGSILHNAKLDPTIAIGGIVKNFGTNAVSGKGEIIVFEADEFDKTFLSLKPMISIINNIEEEHMDCYDNFEDLKNGFEVFANNIPFYGFVLINNDDPNILSISKNIKRPVISYGIKSNADYSAKNISFNKNSTQFDLYIDNKKNDTIELSIPGYHNVYNSLCSIALSIEMGVSLEVIKKSLIEFKGVKRRFDVRFNDGNNIYVDDYAHHPTEVKATIEAIKNGWPNKSILTIFQPHLYSRTKQFYKEFSKSLLSSDKVILLDIYGSREKKIKGVSSGLIKDEIIKSGNTNCTLVNSENLIEELSRIHTDGDLIITMGAGDIWAKGKDIIGYLEK